MDWMWFLKARDRALGREGRWRGKGGFHRGWIPRFSWNCGFGSQVAAWFCLSCCP